MIFAIIPAVCAAPLTWDDVFDWFRCPTPTKFEVAVRFTPPGTLEFVPANLRIKQGDIVTWNFNGRNHSVTESVTNDCSVKAHGFNSGIITTTYTQKFTKKGTFFYNCQAPFHCAMGMKGKIEVSNRRYHDVAVKFTPPTPQSPPKLEYDPALLNIKQDDYVSWHFNGFNHTVTQSDTDDCKVKKNGFNSGLLTTGYTRQFQKKGTFFYNCQAPNHCGLGMKGKIVVRDNK
jgi:plastocyanin